VLTISEKPTAARWRSYLRFSLRGLIVLIVLLGGGLGWIVRSARIQRATVLAIEQSGGSVLYDWQHNNGRYFLRSNSPWPRWLLDRLPVDYFHAVTWVNTGNRAIRGPEALLLRIGNLNQLEELQVRGPRPTDDDLAALRGLHKLRRLHIDGPNFITGVGLVHLKALTNLQTLGLRNCDITDSSLVHLKALTGLQILGLTNCKVTDAGLVHLKGLTNLQELGLANCQITEAGLANLEGLSKLNYLILNGTKIDDDALVHLKTLTSLRFLSLANTRVTDAGLANLEGLKSLTRLWLEGTQVSDAGVQELQKAIPTLLIDR
jgi:hypothetical protein